MGSFEDAAVTKRLRIMGDDVRLFRCFPGDWQARLLSLFFQLLMFLFSFFSILNLKVKGR